MNFLNYNKKPDFLSCMMNLHYGHFLNDKIKNNNILKTDNMLSNPISIFIHVECKINYYRFSRFII